jgi:hypothetical protein
VRKKGIKIPFESESSTSTAPQRVKISSTSCELCKLPLLSEGFEEINLMLF